MSVPFSCRNLSPDGSALEGPGLAGPSDEVAEEVDMVSKPRNERRAGLEQRNDTRRRESYERVVYRYDEPIENYTRRRGGFTAECPRNSGEYRNRLVSPAKAAYAQRFPV